MLANAAMVGGAAMAAGQCVAGKYGVGKYGAGADEALVGRSGLGSGLGSGIDSGGMGAGFGFGFGSGDFGLVLGCGSLVPLKKSALPGCFAAVVCWLRHSTSS